MATINRCRGMACAGVMLLAAAGAAHAGTVQMRHSAGPVMVANVISPDVTGAVITRRRDWTRTDTPGPGVDDTLPMSFIAFGLEIEQGTSDDRDYEYQVVSPAAAGWSPARIDAIQTLWAQRIGEVIGGGDDEACAFQVAVWELMFDTDRDLDSGSFQLISTPSLGNAKSMAQSWLGGVAQGSSWRPVMSIMLHEDVQDQIFAEIPAPGAALVAGLGAAVVGGRRRRRERASA